MTGFALDPHLDVERLRDDFARDGRVRIEPFLAPEAAHALRDHLRGREDWRLVLNAGDKVFEIDRPGQAALSAQQRDELERRVAAAATHGFQYRFESIRVPDEDAAGAECGTMLDALAQFLSSPAVLDPLRRITGAPDIAFADAQATSYGPGDFLTAHDDGVEGKHRRAAYVLGLAPDWRPEWGGLLLFHDDAGDIAHGFSPRFNALSLFAVPQRHSVSQVTAFAAEPRLSVTGWLRARPDQSIE